MTTIANTHIQPVLAAIEAAGGRPLIVGGTVRDWLLGREPEEYDVEVYGLPIDRLVELLSGFGRVDAVGRSFGVLKLRLPGGRELDVALPRRESKVGAGHRGFLAEPDPAMTPREAAARRDFTWNALALTPEGELLDFFGGREDLRAGIIRHTSAAFVEDPLRVLRAMQFAARLDMRLAPETAALCRALLPEAPALAIERVWGEWQKWALKGRRPSAGLRVLRETGWVALCPELGALVGCPQDATWHPEGDVWTHTSLVCDAAAAVAERDGLAGDDRLALVFAGLCHDLGKPATTTFEADGRIRSRGHDAAGVAPTEALLRRIGCPRRVVERAARLVREHMAHLAARPTPRAVRRLAVRLEPATIVEWDRLIEADYAGRPPLPPKTPGRPFVDLARQLGAADGKPAAILQGRHLVEAGMAPGPRLGQILQRAYQAQIDGKFATLDQALAWVARHARGGL
ncbi:MAG: HD domain-containing protein [Kouleothrix sp.]|nr:HD domain-containing protein [Kouleothrix sp.]